MAVLVYAHFVEMFTQEVMGQLAGLRESIASKNYFKIHPAKAYVVLQVVFIDAFLGDVLELDLHVLRFFHGGVQVKRMHVNATNRMFSRDNTLLIINFTSSREPVGVDTS